jgi:hypothetical protein
MCPFFKYCYFTISYKKIDMSCLADHLDFFSGFYVANCGVTIVENTVKPRRAMTYTMPPFPLYNPKPLKINFMKK